MRIRSVVVGRPWGAGVLALLAFLLLVGSRAVGAEPVAGEVAGFHQKAETDRASYEEGELVRLTFTVCRTRPWPTWTSSGNRTALLYGWRILDADGNVVADTTHHVHTADLVQAFWLPGQCRVGEYEWDQRRWNREERRQAGIGTPVTGDRVAPGAYRFEVSWQTAMWDDPPREQAPVESSPFQIEP